MKNLFAIALLLFVLASCDRFLDVEDDADSIAVPATRIELVAKSTDQWTGVAVSKTDRIFVNYPNWREGLKFSVAEIADSVTVHPYPDSEWNKWSGSDPASHFICVQSVYVDRNNILWVIDPANPQRAGEFLGVVPDGAKLVKIDLSTNKVVQVITFQEPVIKKTSYLNDIRIDEDKQIGYITDSNEGAIVVVDLKTGAARRLLSLDPSTKSENKVLIVEGREVRNEQGKLVNFHSDCIALNPDRSFLYWRPVNGTSLYRIATSALNDATLADSTLRDRVEFLRNLPPSDGMIFGMDGLLYLTSIEQNGVVVFDESTRRAQLIVASPDLKWPDSFSVGSTGDVYVTTSQIHLKNPSQPYKVFKFESAKQEKD